MRKRLSILAVLLLAVAISAYSVGGTYAKYTSNFTGGTSTARVAKWAFAIGDGTTALANNFTFGLFDTVVDTVDGNTDADVAAAGDGETTIIAPGTKGEYTIKLRNLSEVNATYSLALSIADGNEIPVEFRVNGGEWTNDLSTAINGSLPMNANSDSEIKIEWQWPYSAVSTVYTDRTDVTDTELGIDGTKSITVNAAITVTQAD